MKYIGTCIMHSEIEHDSVKTEVNDKFLCIIQVPMYFMNEDLHEKG